MGKHRADTDDRGRKTSGRARDRLLDRGSDHGAPHEAPAGSKRADRRAGHTQVVRTGIFGGTKVVRGGREGDLRDRWRG